jgi:hypothetical protein
MYRVSDTVRSTHNQDGAIVLDVREGQMFNLNFVGSRILEFLKSGYTESGIVDEIAREFGVSRDLAERDVRELLQNLKKRHLVEDQDPAWRSDLRPRSWNRHDSPITRLIGRLRSGRGQMNYAPVTAGGVNEVCTMSFLLLKAYLNLIRFDLYLARGNFAAVYDKVRNYPVAKTTPTPGAVECISSAVDMACIWYWREALCLQRSAATTCLLKSHGISARLVIGAQQLPFKAHAWVEVDGRVVNDKPYVPEIYHVLERC